MLGGMTICVTGCADRKQAAFTDLALQFSERHKVLKPDRIQESKLVSGSHLLISKDRAVETTDV